jgi:hypothetical protein
VDGPETPSNQVERIVADFAAVTGIDERDVRLIVDSGSSLEVGAGEWLFHEGSPREHLVIVVHGDVEVLRGMHGDERVIADFGPGTVIGEGLLLDDQPHTTSARCRARATVYLVPRSAFDSLRRDRPELYFQLLSREIRLVYVFGDRFEGYSSGAAWEDTKLGLGNVRSWERTAIVSDHDWAEHLVNALGWLMPGKVRHFEAGAIPEAIAWAGERTTT